MVGLDPRWVRKTDLVIVLLALPSAVLIGTLWWRNRTRKELTNKALASMWVSGGILTLYVLSIVNIVFQWSVSYMIMWPALGIVLAAFALGLAFAAPRSSRSILLITGVLLGALCIISIVPPN